MTEEQEQALVEIVERMTVEFQEIVVRLEVHLGKKWADDSLRTLAALNVSLCEVFPFLQEGG